MSMLSGVDKRIWPCENLCQAQSPLCGGCGRSEYERFAWGLMDDDERKQRVLIIRILYYGNIIDILSYSVLGIIFRCGTDNRSQG